MSTTASKIFSFMPVRQAKKSPSLINNLNFIVHGQLVIPELDTLLLSKPSGLQAIKTTATGLQSSVYTSATDVYNDFEGFDLFAEWHHMNLNDLTISGVTQKLLESTASSTLSDIDVSSEVDLWGTLIVHRVLYESSELIDVCQNFLRVIHLIKYIQAPSNPTTPEILRALALANVVLPSSLFPLPIEAISYTIPPPNTNGGSVNLINESRINQLVAAKEKIVNVFLERSPEKFDLEEWKTRKMYTYRDWQYLPGGLGTNELRNTNFNSAYNKYLRNYNRDSSIQGSRIFNSSEIIKIGNEVAALLGEYNINLTSQSIREILGLLEAAIAKETQNREFKKGYIEGVAIGTSIVSRGDLDELANSSNFTETLNPPIVKPLGVGDFMVIEQKLLRYEESEIAHIENVYKGEHFNKKHRNLQRMEDFSSLDVESSELTETENRSTERFELASEINQMTQQGTNQNASVSVSGNYGPVRGTASFNYGSFSSSMNSNTESSLYAKEVVNRALSRIEQRTRSFRSSLSINEIETSTDRGIDNSQSPIDHVIGLYFWVDKIYENRLLNLGRRLIYEFFIPQPAALHKFASLVGNKSGQNSIQIPIHPADEVYYSSPLRSFADINEGNYMIWCSRYDVVPPSAPPKYFINVAKSISSSDDAVKAISEKIEIPAGYDAKAVCVEGFPIGDFVKIVIGHCDRTLDINPEWDSRGEWVQLDTYSGSVDVSILAHRPFAVNIILECLRSNSTMDEWRLQIYSSIMKKYTNLLEQYRNKEDSIVSNSIFGRNPDLNRSIERTELKRAAIELFSTQQFDHFDAILFNNETGLPSIKYNQTVAEGKLVQFFEKSFEWENMTYEFFPYYWSNKEHWLKSFNLTDSDPLFEQFLKAGYARVLVPVRPSSILELLHFQKTGQIWLGEDQPVIEDENLMNLLKDIKEIDNYPEGMLVDKWEVRVPTNLVKLRAIHPENDPGLPNFE